MPLATHALPHFGAAAQADAIARASSAREAGSGSAGRAGSLSRGPARDEGRADQREGHQDDSGRFHAFSVGGSLRRSYLETGTVRTCPSLPGAGRYFGPTGGREPHTTRGIGAWSFCAYMVLLGACASPETGTACVVMDENGIVLEIIEGPCPKFEEPRVEA